MILRLRNSKLFKGIVCLTALNLLSYTFYPTAGYALTGGPSQPEFSSFEPVAATDMVDLYSGDFTYNLPVVEIPGPHGSGYAMSLAYHSGVTPEQEASWVGLGWTLNPGAINRARRGLPDDYDGDPVEMLNIAPPNTTVSVGANANFELYSFDALQLSAANRWNSYRGFSTVTGVNLPVINGLVNLGFSVENGDLQTVADYNPGRAMNLSSLVNLASSSNSSSNSKKAKSTSTGSAGAENAVKYAQMLGGQLDKASSQYGMYLMGADVRPSNLNSYRGISVNLNFAIQANIAPLHIGVSSGVSANVNRQISTEPQTMRGFGWMYSGNASTKPKTVAMMDYSLEKDIPYTRRDKYLPIPVNNHDVYSVTGEGVRGGFRSFNKNIGYFSPTEKHSYSNIINVSIEPGVGMANAFGGSAGFGHQDVYLKDWTVGDDDRKYARPGIDDEGIFFRFNGDLGGSVDYEGTDMIARAGVSTTGLKGIREGSYSYPEGAYELSLSSSTGLGLPTSRSGRSSYIGYHTNEEMTEQVNGKAINSYERNASTESLTQRDAEAVKARVGEFAVCNENGQRYTYGLPVYTRHESEINYHLYPHTDNFNVVDNMLVYDSGLNEDDAAYYNGQKRNNPYPASHLLTEITTPDYIDRTLDGATSDDFGGYTKFEYRRLHGNSNYDADDDSEWYKWRIPFTGLAYSPNSPSSYLDDLATVSSGYKEVYYLKCVKTKTHVAYFITNKTDITLPNGLHLKGSQDPRLDGREADHLESAASTSSSAIGDHELEYLERIEVYALDSNGDPEELLKTTRFEYDYSLCPETPNNFNTSQQLTENTGKLTLKKVWFEHNGVLNAKIAPYKFDYGYKKSTSFHPSVVARYPEISSYADNFEPANAGDPEPENMPYHVSMTDRWGNYRADGMQKAAQFDPYVNQKPVSNFDPASWHLKQISLPTGGEILVHYEQDDYSKVQNQPAMAMVELDANPGGQGFLLKAGETLGLTNSEVGELAKLMQHQFVEKGERIQFNFLYELLNDNATFKDCNTENIKGYAKVTTVVHEADKIRITLDAPDRPKELCRNFYKKNRVGQNGCGEITQFDGELTKGEAKQLTYKILGSMSGIPATAFHCVNYDVTRSSFRIPVWKRKLGGGVRVKRLMLYDEGLEADNADAVLYGTEYEYTTNDEFSNANISSGVASNEPSMGRDENALVRYFDLRKDQKNWQKHGDAIDLMQFEGPLGESLLPAATVGYCRVTTRNIHKGKSNPGFQVTDFYTTADAPTTRYEQYDDGESWHLSEDYMQSTPMGSSGDHFILPALIYNRFVNNIWRSQAYRFLQWNISGRLKGQATYTSVGQGNAALSSSTTYSYKTPGETVPMFYGWNDIRQEEPGKEVDVSLARRSITDHLNDGSLQFDAGVQIYGPYPIPFASAMFYFTQNIAEMHSHVSSTVIQYPAILDTVVSITDGIESMVAYDAYNPETGAPVITTSFDGHHDLTLGLEKHDGSYKTTNFPASGHYTAMGQKAFNERAILRSNTMQNGCGLHITKSTDGPSNESHYFDLIVTGTCSEEEKEEYRCAALNKITAGDLVRVREYMSNYDGLFHVERKEGNRVRLLKPDVYGQGSIALSGTHYDVEVEVLRSGKTNQLNASRGAVTTYGEPRATTAVPMDQTQKALREVFAGQLQTEFNTLTDGQSSLLPSTTWDPALKYIDGNGDCSKLSGNTSVLLVADNAAPISSECCDGSQCPQELKITAPVGTSIAYDSISGKLVLGDPLSCTPVFVECITFCPATYPLMSLGAVIAASALTYSDDWNWSAWNFGPYSPPGVDENIYETGRYGKWRPKATYAYKSDLISGNGPNGRNYADAGVFEEFTFFNWAAPEGSDPNWIRASEITYYSPNGEALEERNALDIYSVAKLSHNASLVELHAGNATLNQVEFNSFEDHVQGENWHGAIVSKDVAHSGKQSAKVTPAGAEAYVSLPGNLIDETGAACKLWVHSGDAQEGSIQLQLSDGPDEFGNTEYYRAWLGKVAQVGEWTLYSAQVDVPAAGNYSSMLIFHNWNSEFYIDDLRIQPKDAAMTGYVYDSITLRLLASFDDQNFGTFYQYNAEGKLIRRLIETERGLRTLQEQQYHTPEEPRQQP